MVRSASAKGTALGPFKGGLNNVSEVSTINDDQLAILLNFDIDNDGTLVNRPAIEREANSPSSDIVATNFATDPEFTSVTSTVVEGSATLSTVSGQPAVTAQVIGTAVRATSTATGASYATIKRTVSGITQGTAYSLSGYVSLSGAAGTYQIFVDWLASNGSTLTTVSSTPVATNGSTPVRVLLENIVAPPGAVSAAYQFRCIRSSAVGAWHQLTAVAFTADTSAVAFFDGSTPTTGQYAYTWKDQPATSVSYRRDTTLPAAITPIGYYTRSDGEIFAVCATPDATWLYQVSTKQWQQIWSVAATDFAQYDNKIVMISDTASGGYWEAGNFTATPTMPLGSQIVVYNDRFWASGVRGTPNGTTVYFSNLTVISPAQSIYDWQPSTNFFTVGKGDGQYITVLVADPTALFIFRNASTYTFTYPTSPLTGSLRQVNPTIGADSAYSVVPYENYYFVLNQGFLYQFISYQFYPRNAKLVTFRRSSAAPSVTVAPRVSVLGARVIVWFYGSVYVYNLNLQAWAEWSSTLVPASFLQIPMNASPADPRRALVFTGTGGTRPLNGVYTITDSPSAGTAGEVMSCLARTKAYTFDVPGEYKRMLYWAISYRSASGVHGTATPAGQGGGATTWNDMNAATWNTLNLGSWNSPLSITPVFRDDIPYPASAAVQKLAKAKAAIRFLSAYFDIALDTTGTGGTAPARVFSVTAYLKQHAGTKQKVS